MKNFHISEKLLNLLKQIEDQSYVARLLTDSNFSSDEHLPVLPGIDYLSISDDDPSKISYLSEQRIKTIQTTEELWTSQKRFHCKPGTFVGKIFRDISFHEIEKFSNLFRAYSVEKNFTFEIVSGHDIKNWYLQNTYQSCSGSLAASCMRYEICQNYFDIYSDNTEISMLIMRDSKDLLIGRALLWHFQNHKIMDRIYTVCDEDYQFYFKKWAYDNNYLHKSRQNWSNTLQFDSKVDKFVEIKLSLNIKNFNYDFYPYLDTFKWLDKSGNLSNFKPEGSNFITLSHANGGFERYDYLELDDLGRDWHYQGNLIPLPENGILTSDRFLNYCEYLDRWILKSDSIYSVEYRDYVYKDDQKNNYELLNARLQYFTSNDEKETQEKTLY